MSNARMQTELFGVSRLLAAGINNRGLLFVILAGFLLTGIVVLAAGPLGHDELLSVPWAWTTTATIVGLGLGYHERGRGHRDPLLRGVLTAYGTMFAAAVVIGVLLANHFYPGGEYINDGAVAGRGFTLLTLLVLVPMTPVGLRIGLGRSWGESIAFAVIVLFATLLLFATSALVFAFAVDLLQYVTEDRSGG